MSSDIFIPSSPNLSLAWAEAFIRVMGRGVTELSPLVITVTDIADEVPVESKEIRQTLDAQLRRLDLQSCHTVANTIFPESMWNPNSSNDADQLFQRFERAWPRIRRCPANHRGSYFRRLTAYCPSGSDESVNQLEHVVNTYRKGNHRRSALQASVFDPTRDHNDCRQLGFPCLHQVAFTPIGSQGLSVTGFYATQFLLERAYGNYLGLCRLGRFMAKQMGLTFEKMICIASVAQRGAPTKTQLQPLTNELAAILAKAGEAQA
ncbi:MAG: thymidylate synthase [Planctomycetota bacterium]|nr:MAG: thymidylate synthase [Planctomycetota bacterium]REJ92084.1 MAG: thymidylate synthase [Planctomycetota bacterium]REK28620.1 MAG: thymidylate synthase [Planctomycetota bacterium]REK39234.1 MAG: thymidylate synthase [Planctomycetota bacterium]